MSLSSPPTYSESDSHNQTDSQQDVDQHQKLLEEQLDWLTVDHDDLRQDLLERISTPKYHSSMTVIDRWEEQTIARIRHTAVLARRALIHALDQHVLEVQNRLNMLTPKLRDARNYIRPFNDEDIHEWTSVLQKLKQMPVFPVTADKDNNIHGLTIDLRKEKRTHHSESNREESTSCCLVSLLCDPIAFASTFNKTEHQIVPTHLTIKTNGNNRKVNFGNVSTHRTETVTPGKVTINREQQKEKPSSTFIHVRQPHTEIPFNSKS